MAASPIIASINVRIATVLRAMAGSIAVAINWGATATAYPRINAAIEEGVFDAGQISARRGGLALSIAGEGAIAQSGKFVTLKAKGISASNGVRRHRAAEYEGRCGDRGQDDGAHGIPDEAGLNLNHNFNQKPEFPSTTLSFYCARPNEQLRRWFPSYASLDMRTE